LLAVATGGCKTVKETASTRATKDAKQADTRAVEPSMVVTTAPVPLEKIPAVVAKVDVTNCLGAGKWYDSSRPATPRPGAVSLTLNSNTALPAGEAQPEAMYFEPVMTFGGTTTSTPRQAFTWRVKAGRYTLTVVAIAVDSNKVESRISAPVDLTTALEQKILVKGTWTGTSACGLEFQL
jgi:hypothetical protein